MLKKRKYLFKRLIYILLLCLLFTTNACSKKSNSDLCFAVIGDLHYMTPDFRTAVYLVPSVAKELAGLTSHPEFIIQTGDFFHGNRGTDIESEALFAFKNFSGNMALPFYIAKGNHDTREYYEKNALPLFSRESGSDVLKAYYSFNKANCHFIMLDCTAEKLDDQLSWLEKDIETAKSNPKIEHIFAAGHYPLWIVARAGFTRQDYAVPVSLILAKYKVDAYFCGHTHNKTTTVRLINGQPLTQIMDAAVVEEDRLFNLASFLMHTRAVPEDNTKPGTLALEEGHQIFIPKSELLYYWGYQEGSTTSYNILTVNGKSVRVDWHVLGKGLIRSYKWDVPGKLVDLKVPAAVNKDTLKDTDFKQIETAWFYAAPWTNEDSITAPFSINGIPIGAIGMSRAKMAFSPFWNKIEIPLDRTAINAIKKENEIRISNPSSGRFGLAHMFLLVKFTDGRFAKSSLSQKVITSFQPGEGIQNFPAPQLIEAVEAGKPLTKVILRFGYFYAN